MKYFRIFFEWFGGFFLVSWISAAVFLGGMCLAFNVHDLDYVLYNSTCVAIFFGLAFGFIGVLVVSR